jgi:hypothetical protein
MANMTTGDMYTLYFLLSTQSDLANQVAKPGMVPSDSVNTLIAYASTLGIATDQLNAKKVTLQHLFATAADGTVTGVDPNQVGLFPTMAMDYDNPSCCPCGNDSKAIATALHPIP